MHVLNDDLIRKLIQVNTRVLDFLATYSMFGPHNQLVSSFWGPMRHVVLNTD